MPLVPVFNGEPFSSILGVMHFPGDMHKARLFASWYFARLPLESVSDADLLRLLTKDAAHFPPFYEESRKAHVAGTAVGAMTWAMFRLIHAHEKIATWDRAVKVVRNHDGGLSSSRPTLMGYRAQMRKVAHFWGALRSGKFGSLEEFCARAQIMGKRIFDFEIAHSKSTGKSEYAVHAAYLNAFHVDVAEGVGVTIETAQIPASLLREPIAKREQKKPSEKIRTIATPR
jgi:hypothetical protein